MPYHIMPDIPWMTDAQIDRYVKQCGAPSGINRIKGTDQSVVMMRDGAAPPWPPNATLATSADCIPHLNSEGGFDF